jgi:uncharacterized protein with HEPN domain
MSPDEKLRLTQIAEAAALIADYGPNIERLWETATQDIPVIKRVVENFLEAHTDPN